MKLDAALLPVAALGALLAGGPLAASQVEKHVVEKTFAFIQNKEIPVGVRVGEASIDSLRLRNGPTEDDFAKAQRDPEDSHSVDFELRYSNRNESRNYKCRTTVLVVGPNEGTVFAETDKTQTLDRGKVGETNRFSVRMKTRNYKLAKSIKVTFEIWKD